MGMIMKDGVPYGGVYPIDDVPTQGSDNTVKSGGVFSSLSNKVDKVTGKGLSTNDYSDTEKGKVADNTAAIKAIENVTGTKNVLPLKLADIKNEPGNTGTWSGNSYTYGGVTFTFTVDGNDYVIDIATSGTSTVAFNVTFGRHAEGFSKYSGMVLNGCPEVNNVSLFILLDISPYTEYAIDRGEGDTIATISDGSRVWFGINIGAADIDMSGLHFYPMIRPAGTDPTYIPYAMTNRELTERAEELICPVNIDKFGSYINAGGGLNDLWPYYVASVPVSEGMTIKILNPATNTSTYNRFYDNTNQPIGDVIQNPSSGSLTLTVPTGAVMLKLTMYNNSGAPRLKIS